MRFNPPRVVPLSRHPKLVYDAVTMSQGLKVGDHVRCTNGPESTRDDVGVIIDISPSALGISDLTVYEVLFDFGVRYLFGDQIEPFV
jgi:hypothetical protein